MRIVDRILDNIFVLEELVGHQLTVVVFKVSQHIRDGVVDRIVCEVADIREVCFLDRGNNSLQGIYIHSRRLSEQTHSLGVCDPHVGIRVSGCVVRDDKRAQVSWVEGGSG